MESLAVGRFTLTFTKIGGVEYREDLATIKPTSYSPPRLYVTDKLHPQIAIQVNGSKFLQQCLRDSSLAAMGKVRIPAPTALHFPGGRENVSRKAYTDLDLFFQEGVAAGDCRPLRCRILLRSIR